MSDKPLCFCGEPLEFSYSVVQDWDDGACRMTHRAIVHLCRHGHASCDLPLGHPFLSVAISKAKEAFRAQALPVVRP